MNLALIRADLIANDYTLREAIDDAILYSKSLAPLLAALRTDDDAEVGRIFRALVEAELSAQAEDTLLFRNADLQAAHEADVAAWDETPRVVAPLTPCEMTGDPS